MVFPSLMFQIDQGIASQLSAWVVILFSFLLYRFKKIIITFFIVLFAVVLFQSHAFAFGAGTCGTGCQFQLQQSQMNNMNYYGRPMGYASPVYFYPQLPYQSMWPQQNYYFQHSPSPYQPVDCPFCNQQNYQQTQPFFFPNSNQFPGGGIT